MNFSKAGVFHITNKKSQLANQLAHDVTKNKLGVFVFHGFVSNKWNQIASTCDHYTDFQINSVLVNPWLTSYASRSSELYLN